jgi:hypothetical protein
MMPEQFTTYLRDLGTTDSGSAPNYNEHPLNADVAKEEDRNSSVIPFCQNFFFEPVYTREFP